jgi:hypothetical protein
VGEDAIRATTVSDDLSVSRYFSQAPAQLRNRDGNRTRKVRAVVLLARSNIEDDRWRTLPEPSG